MGERKPLVLLDGVLAQLPPGDTLPGATVAFETEQAFDSAVDSLADGTLVVKLWEPAAYLKSDGELTALGGEPGPPGPPGEGLDDAWKALICAGL